MCIHIYIHIYIYTYTHTHIYTHTYNIYLHLHSRTYRHIYIHTYINTCKTICNLFRESPHPDLESVATSQLNRDKSQITGFRKMRDTRVGNTRTESSNISQ